MKPPRQQTTARGRIPNAPRPEPWKPPEWQPEDAHAVQAVAHGRASEEQQRRAMNFIVHSLCGTYDMQFRPGGREGDRDTCFALGRDFVGKQLIKFINLNLSALKQTGVVGASTAAREQP